MDWVKDFEKLQILIPYADDFVFKTRAQKRVENANMVFNEFYDIQSKVNIVKVKFSETVEIIYNHESIDTEK